MTSDWSRLFFYVTRRCSNGPLNPVDLECRVEPRLRAGVTLIEMLCVVAIIGVLAALLLGPAGRVLGKARAMQWADQAERATEEIRQRLHPVFASQTDFPTMTLEKLETSQLLTPSQLLFLRDRRVKFTPFAGKDPDTLPVVAAELKAGFLTSAGTVVLTKGELTEPLK